MNIANFQNKLKKAMYQLFSMNLNRYYFLIILCCFTVLSYQTCLGKCLETRKYGNSTCKHPITALCYTAILELEIIGLLVSNKQPISFQEQEQGDKLWKNVCLKEFRNFQKNYPENTVNQYFCQFANILDTQQARIFNEKSVKRKLQNLLSFFPRKNF